MKTKEVETVKEMTIEEMTMTMAIEKEEFAKGFSNISHWCAGIVFLKDGKEDETGEEHELSEFPLSKEARQILSDIAYKFFDENYVNIKIIANEIERNRYQNPNNENAFTYAGYDLHSGFYGRKYSPILNNELALNAERTKINFPALVLGENNLVIVE